MAGNKYNIDMTKGAIFPKVVRFTLPLIAANTLQLVFHAIDLMVIGRFASPQALAAIGATTAVNSMIVTIFTGLAVGTNVLAARYFGSKDHHRLHLTVHTSAAFSIWGGILLALGAILTAKPLLAFMETPPDILQTSSMYLWLTFFALPFLLFYNTGASVLRAFGNTRQPLFFLLAGTGVKVVLNLVFVIVCKFDVAGVAVATIFCHVIMGILILRTLLHGTGAARLRWKQIRFESSSLKDILKLGVPASIQSSSYSIANVIIQSTINTFGAQAIAGNTAAAGLEGFIHVGSTAFYQAAMCFAAQNHGAGEIARIRRGILICIAAGGVVAGLGGLFFACFGSTLLTIFTSDPETIQFAMVRVRWLFTLFFIIGIMEAVAGSLRGLGYSTSAMCTTLAGVCVFRIAWIIVVFPHVRTLASVYATYPISWALVALMNGLLLWYACRQLEKEKEK